MINNYILLQKKLIERNALKIMYKMKCISKDRSGEPCNFRKVGETLFCKFHQHMVDYTPEMLEQIKSCSTCRKMYYLGEYSTCDSCRDRGGKNRETNKQTVVKCNKDTCKYKKSDENKYCKLHQIELFLDETKEMGLKNCANYVRGCREQLDTEYKFSRCQPCLKKDRENDHKKRGSVAEAPKVEGMKMCSVCCKTQPESEYIGLKGETKTCRECRDGFKRADDKRDNEHVKELARENALKPERQEVKKEWRENNKEKVILYWMNYRQRKMNEDIDNYRKHNAERQQKWRELNPEKVHAQNEKNKNNIKYSFENYKRCAFDKQLPFEFEYIEYEEIVHCKCHYCGNLHDKGFNGIVRIDSKIGYIKTNCVSCCETCNMMKGCLSMDVFIQIIEHILTINKMIEGNLFYEAFHNYKPEYSSYKASADSREIDFEIDKEIYDNITFNDCYICGKCNTETHHNGLDRYDSSIGYLYMNIRPCCGTCNFMKKDLNYNDFMDKCLDIYNHFIKNNNVNVSETNTKFIIKGNKLTKEQKTENKIKRDEIQKEKMIEKYNDEDYKIKHARELIEKRK